MSKMTLLELTQSCLSAMNSDDVNSITDTEEALQVSAIIEDTHNELMTRSDWNHLKLPIPLLSLADSDYPTTLQLPSTVVDISMVRYNCKTSVFDADNFKKLTYKDPNDFLDSVLSRSSTASNVESKTVKGSTAPIYVLNDSPPSFWTSFDEEYLTFDAYVADVENTLQGAKSIVYATQLPSFTMDDTFVPNLPATMFPQFLAECKKACFFYLKEQMSPVDEKRALRGQSLNNFRNTRAHERRTVKRYGRR